jgi:hypothetical protein
LGGMGNSRGICGILTICCDLARVFLALVRLALTRRAAGDRRRTAEQHSPLSKS